MTPPRDAASYRLKAWAIALAMLSPVPAFALEPDKIFEKVAPSIWTVRALDAQERLVSQGSAVVIGPGQLITNCHVLRRARAIQIRQDNVIHVATLEFPDAERDLCQLSVRDFTAPPVTIAPSGGLKVGQRAFAIGSPRGLELTMSDGILSALRAGDDGAPLLQTTAAISAGSSGGGLFDIEGRLIGITTAQRRDGQNLNFAVPAGWIAEVPERGQAALDKRREVVASAATAPSAAAVTSEFPKQITGEAFVNFFQANRLLNGTSGMGKPLKLQLYGWYVDGYTQADAGDAVARSTDTLYTPSSLRGSQRIRAADNQICVDFSLSPSMFWRGHSGCFHLLQTGPKDYLLRPVKDAIEFRFALK